MHIQMFSAFTHTNTHTLTETTTHALPLGATLLLFVYHGPACSWPQ